MTRLTGCNSSVAMNLSTRKRPWLSMLEPSRYPESRLNLRAESFGELSELLVTQVYDSPVLQGKVMLSFLCEHMINPVRLVLTPVAGFDDQTDRI